MIPIRLTIEGLFSYQEAQTVDFTRLCEPKLFGIFGAVGSGKSSILEAIMFALYNKTDRLPRDNQNYNMMNLRSDRMRIEFEFEVSEGERYFFTVEGKRSGKDFDKVATFQRNAYRMEGGEWIPLEKHTAEDILGLSYDNFRRTIIIPQGKFQEFLQLGDKDRTAMMKEIFQLDRFELYPAAAQLEAENKEAMDILIGKLSSVEGLNEELIEEKTRVLDELEVQKKAQNERLAESEVRRADWKERAQYFERLQREKRSMQELQQRDIEFRKRKELLEKFERIRNEFALPLDRLKTLESELAREQTALAYKTEEHGKLRAMLSRLTQDIEQQEKTPEEEKHESRIIEDLRCLAEIRIFDQQLGPLVLRRKDLEAQLKGILEKTGPGAELRQSLENELHSLTGKVGDVSEMAGWMKSIERWQEEGKRLKMERSDLEKQLTNWTRIITTIPLPDRSTHSDPEQVHRYILTGMKNSETAYESAHDAWLKGASHQHIAEIRQQLKEGEPCPVCGSVHHPDPAPAEQANGKDLTAQLKQADTGRKAWQEAYQRLMEHWSDGKSLRDQLESVRNKLSETANAFLEVKNAFPVPGVQVPEDKDLFREFIAQQAGSVQRYSEITKKLSEIQQMEKSTEVHKKETEHTLAELEKEILRAESGRDILKARLVALSGAENWLQGKEPAKLAEEKEREKTERIRRLELLKKDKERVEKEWLGLDKETGILRARIEELEKERGIKVRDLEHLLEAHGEDTLEEVRKVMDMDVDPEKERRALEAHFMEISRASENLKELEGWLRERPYDQQEHADLEKQWEASKKELEEILRKETEHLTELKRLKADLALKQELLKEKENLELRGENIRTLKNLFRSSGFVQYISRVYLENICNAANARFITLTRRQLALQLSEKDEFEVVDYLNDGKTRSVRTLSGGQTFQASLCLALALAESVQSQARSKQNFFFLDEGFGSLDKDSLQTVFETLKSLRKEHRIVGIISHVEDLQQEIQSFVRITMDQEKGSKVRYSWE